MMTLSRWTAVDRDEEQATVTVLALLQSAMSAISAGELAEADLLMIQISQQATDLDWAVSTVAWLKRLIERRLGTRVGGRHTTRRPSPNATLAQRIGAQFRLSDREQEVLTLLGRGFSAQQIARELFISASTVSYHLSNMYAKTGVTSRHQLTAMLWEDRLLSA